MGWDKAWQNAAFVLPWPALPPWALPYVPCALQSTYVSHSLLSTHVSNVGTLAGQLASRRQPDRRWGSASAGALLPASTNKVLRWELFACWQDELELLQSLATSDGSWLDELLPCPPSPPSDSSAAPSLVASSEDDDAWGSPPSSPRVTPALVARLNSWITSSSQFAKTGQAEPLSFKLGHAHERRCDPLH